MGWIPLDYFKCEPFELIFRLYVFGGFWPLQTDVGWKKILFSIFSFLCYFSLTSMIFIQVVDIYLLRNDPVNLTKDLCSISISFTIVIKSILILYKVNVINYLKDKFTEYKNTRTDPTDVEILENSNRQILVVLKTFYSMALPCVVFWMLYPGLDSPEKGVPFPYRLPVEHWTFPVYVGLYVYQSLSMVGYMINTIAVDTIFCGFVLRINAHYDVIIKDIKELGNLKEKTCDERHDEQVEREEYTKSIEETLRNIIDLHKETLREVKILESIYGSSCFVHFLGMITITGTAIIDFVRIAKGFRLQLLQKLLFVTVALWDSFLYCFFANKLQQKSLDLSWATYGAHWYNMKPQMRRDLMFISFKCQQLPRLKVSHLFYLNLKTFLNLLKISYDITALLFHSIKV